MSTDRSRSVLHLGSAALGAAALVLATASVGSAAPEQAPIRPAQAAPGSTSAYLVQGVPGTAVDVTLDGKSVKSDLAAKGIVGPMNLAAGSHTVEFAAADWKVESSFDTDGGSIDVVLHWPADKAAKPDVTVFDNDLRPIASTKGRLTVAHTAIVPPADVRVDEKVLFSNIANGEFVTANVPATSYSVDIVPTGLMSNPVFGPVTLPVEAGQLTRVFAIGEPAVQSMDAIVQTIPLKDTGSRAPDTVNAGGAGLVAPNETSGSLEAVAASAAIVVVGAGAVVFATRRRQALPRR